MVEAKCTIDMYSFIEFQHDQIGYFAFLTVLGLKINCKVG